ncbi:cytochrome P450 2G1-like [Morus bassanus]
MHEGTGTRSRARGHAAGHGAVHEGSGTCTRARGPAAGPVTPRATCEGWAPCATPADADRFPGESVPQRRCSGGRPPSSSSSSSLPTPAPWLGGRGGAQGRLALGYPLLSTPRCRRINSSGCPRGPASPAMEPSGTATFLLLLALILFLASRRRGGQRAGCLPPGPPALPVVGNLLQISPSHTLRSLLKLSETYGPVFAVWLGARRVLVLRGHAAVREALGHDAEAFAGRGRMPTVEETFRGHGLVFSNGERWRQLRRFSLTVLRDFGMGRKSIEARIQEEAQILLQELRGTREQPFDPTYLLSCATSNIISAIVFGDRFDYRDEEFLELLRLMNEVFREISTPWSQFYEMGETFLKHLPGPHTKIPRLLARMRSFVARRVRRNAETLEPGHPRDFIDCFLLQMEKEKDNPSSEFNAENLELTTLNLFFAGTETVSSTLRYGFLMLMKHPAVQEKVHEEIERVIGRNRPPAIEDRSRMPYTDAVIHEIQRCSDLIPMNVPHAVTRDTFFRGYFIPKGTEVYTLLSSVLHDPSAFKHPDTFDPTNFLDESGCFKKNEAFVPFSLGKRVCLGEALARMELFLFLTTILQSLRLEPLVPPAQLPTAPLESGFANIPPMYQLRMVSR